MINVLYAMEASYLDSFVKFKNDLDKLKSMATPDQIDQAKAAFKEIQVSSGQSFTVSDGVAHIPISGTLTPKPEFCVSLKDGSQTIYSSIIESTKMAEDDHSVEKIVYDVDSPGGYVSGLDSAAIAIKSAKKPTESHVHNMAASAAYWLASQTDKVIAMNPAVQLGSIGVAVETVDHTKAMEKYGYKRIVLTSSNAPDKRVDIGTDEGQKKVIAELDDLENVFISRVADGRKTTVDNVKRSFGRGGVLIANDALKAGMVDEVKNEINLNNNVSSENETASIVSNLISQNIDNKKKPEGHIMTLDELKQKHPEAYQAALNAGIEQGRTNEQARVTKLSGWKKNGEACAKIADEAIVAGKTFDDVMSELVLAANAKPKKDDGGGDGGDPAANAVIDSEITGDTSSVNQPQKVLTGDEAEAKKKEEAVEAVEIKELAKLANGGR